MFFVRRPPEEDLRLFLETERKKPFSYRDVAATRVERPPAGYVVDHNRVSLGRGAQTFDAAVAAMRRWETFRLGWVELLWPDAPITEGAAVAILVRIGGLWSLNACRIVYVLDEPPPRRRFGFAYGTLPAHAESGEERFRIEWDAADDSVSYDILAFSRPGHWLTSLGRPIARRFQKRFARDSLAAMRRAAGGELPRPRLR